MIQIVDVGIEAALPCRRTTFEITLTTNSLRSCWRWSPQKKRNPLLILIFPTEVYIDGGISQIPPTLKRLAILPSKERKLFAIGYDIATSPAPAIKYEKQNKEFPILTTWLRCFRNTASKRYSTDIIFVLPLKKERQRKIDAFTRRDSLFFSTRYVQLVVIGLYGIQGCCFGRYMFFNLHSLASSY